MMKFGTMNASVPCELGKNPVICVVGLGYVGYPLAEAFSKHFRTIGFDIDRNRVEYVCKKCPKIEATFDSWDIKQADYIMICVPTPVLKNKQPDLHPINYATQLVAQNLKRGATVVLESTVYPGVTEDIMGVNIEIISGLKCGKDFKIGYSPERINPGDKEHELSHITKIVAGMDEETLKNLVAIYSKITNVYPAKSIRVAEAAKIIENIQRDLNIALMNELSIIFNKLNIEMKDVLEAAETKWNFLKFYPGLVGGHCIPVDPYYLVSCAEEVGYHPEVILAGRSINDSMPKYVAELAIKGLNNAGKVIKGSKVLIMGLTYKENVPDIRESPAKEIIKELKEYGVEVFGHDPLLSIGVIEGMGANPDVKVNSKFDAIIITVPHNIFKLSNIMGLCSMMNDNPVLIDIKGMIQCTDEDKKKVYYKSL